MGNEYIYLWSRRTIQKQGLGSRGFWVKKEINNGEIMLHFVNKVHQNQCRMHLNQLISKDAKKIIEFHFNHHKKIFYVSALFRGCGYGPECV